MKQIESDFLADTRQVSPLHLNHATLHRTTHLTAFVSSSPVLPPTVNFGLNVTVIGNRKLHNTTSSNTPLSPAVSRY
jgi:hypothetical protein